MKASAVLCAVLAGTFGFSTIASAQQWHGGDRDHDRGERHEQRHDRGDRGDRGDHRWDRGERREWRGHDQQRYGYDQPHYVYSQPRHAYSNAGHRYYRGGYLPRAYLGGSYYVGNWNSYPGLYAPPYGYQWVNVDGQFLLVALATGLIANALINGY